MDIRKIKKLIELLDESGVAEIEIKEGEESVRISRSSGIMTQAPMAMHAPMMVAPAAAPAAEAAPAAPAMEARTGTTEIKVIGLRRKIAERINAIARAFFIPVVENKPLARSLYAACEVGQEIPEEFYQAVAEILSQIFQRDHDQYEAIRSRIHG